MDANPDISEESAESISNAISVLLKSTSHSYPQPSSDEHYLVKRDHVYRNRKVSSSSHLKYDAERNHISTYMISQRSMVHPSLDRHFTVPHSLFKRQEESFDATQINWHSKCISMLKREEQNSTTVISSDPHHRWAILSNASGSRIIAIILNSAKRMKQYIIQSVSDVWDAVRTFLSHVKVRFKVLINDIFYKFIIVFN